MDPALVARLGRLGGWPPGDDDAAVGRRQLSLTASWALVALHWHALLLGLWVGLLLGALPSGAVFGPGAWILPGWAAALLLAHGIWLRQLRRGPHRLLGLPWRMTTLVLMGTLVGTLVGAPSPVPAAWLHGLGGLDLVLAAAPLLARAGFAQRRRHRADTALCAAAQAGAGDEVVVQPARLLDAALALYGFAAMSLLGLIGGLLILLCRAVRLHREGAFAFVCPRGACGLRLEDPKLVCVVCHDAQPAQESPELRTWPSVERPLLAVCPLCRRPHPVWRTLAEATRRRELLASPASCRHDCGLEAIDGRRRLRIAVLAVGPDGIARLLRQLQDAVGADCGARIPSRPPILRALFVPAAGRQQICDAVIKGRKVLLTVQAFDLLRSRQWIGGFDLGLLLTLPDPLLSPGAQAGLILRWIEVDRAPAGPAPQSAPRRWWRRLLGPARDLAESTHLRGRHPRLALIHADGRTHVEPPSPDLQVVQGRAALRRLLEEMLT
jgi:hypothetical protein